MFTPAGKALSPDHTCSWTPLPPQSVVSHANGSASGATHGANLALSNEALDQYILYCRNLVIQTEDPPTASYSHTGNATSFNYRLPVLDNIGSTTTTSISSFDVLDGSGKLFKNRSSIVPLESDGALLQHLNDCGNSIPLAINSLTTGFSLSLASSAARWRKYYQSKALTSSLGWKGVYARRSNQLVAAPVIDKNLTAAQHASVGEMSGFLRMPISRDVDADRLLGEDAVVNDDSSMNGGSNANNASNAEEHGDMVTNMDVDVDNDDANAASHSPKKVKRKKHKTLAATHNPADIQISTEKRARGTDKTELKNRWASLLLDCLNYVEDLTTEHEPVNYHRPSATLLHDLLNDANDLAVPEQGPGEDYVDRTHKALLEILEHMNKARDFVAGVHDAIYDATNSDNGVALLQFHRMYNRAVKLTVAVPEEPILLSIIELCEGWECKLDKVMDDNDGKPTLAAIHELLLLSNNFPIRMRSVVKLENVVAKVLEVASLVQCYMGCDDNTVSSYLSTSVLSNDASNNVSNNSSGGGSGVNGASGNKVFNLRTAQALLKEGQKTNIEFPELKLLEEEVNKGDEWHDKAIKAIRTKVTLEELKELVLEKKSLVIQFEEIEKKLLDKLHCANEFIDLLENTIVVDKDCNNWERLLIYKQYYNKSDEQRQTLENLFSDGVKVPVIIPLHVLVGAAIQTYEWKIKSQSALTKNNGLPLPALLKRLLDKASSIKKDLPLTEEQLNNWKLPNEDQVKAVIATCDNWLQSYKDCTTGSKKVTVLDIKRLISEGKNMAVDLDSEVTQLEEAYSRCMWWLQRNRKLLRMAGVDVNADEAELNSFEPPSELVEKYADEAPFEDSDDDLVRIAAMKKAAAAASGRRWRVKLHEASAVKQTLADIAAWAARCALVFPDNLIDLTAPAAPAAAEIYADDTEMADTDANADGDDANGDDAAPASDDAGALVSKPAFSEMTELIELAMKFPVKFKEDVSSFHEALERVSSWIDESMQTVTSLSENVEDFLVPHERATIGTDEQCDVDANMARLELILSVSAETSVTTSVEQLARLFSDIHDFHYDARTFLKEEQTFADNDAKLNAMKDSAEKLLARSEEEGSLLLPHAALTASFFDCVKEWLTKLRSEAEKRAAYLEFKTKVGAFFQGEKKNSLGTMEELATLAASYPSEQPPVTKIVEEKKEAERWLRRVAAILTVTDETVEIHSKVSMDEAKEIVAAGEKLHVNVLEILKALKQNLRLARNWSAKVKKSGLAAGNAEMTDVSTLESDANAFCIDMPEEMELIQQATCGYCICRNPYGGFMLGCDSCDEWYHGACLNLTEHQAEKAEKYYCVRCSIEKVFKESAEIGLDLCNKWNNRDECEKQRQAKLLKLQKKWKKEQRDLQKKQGDIEKATQVYNELLWSHASAASSAAADGGTLGGLGGLGGGAPAPVVLETEEVLETDADDDEGKAAVTAQAAAAAQDAATASAAPAVAPATSDPAPAAAAEVNGNGEAAVSSLAPLGALNFEAPLNLNFAPIVDDSAPLSLNMASAPAPVVRSDQEHAAVLKNAKSIVDRLANGAANCQKRIDGNKLEEDRLNQTNAEEDRFSLVLGQFFLEVKRLVWQPRTPENVRLGSPSEEGELSKNMNYCVERAKQLNLVRFADVKTLFDKFRETSWCFLAITVMRKKPSYEELQKVVQRSAGIRFTDERPLRMIKTIYVRAQVIVERVTKTLRPIPNLQSKFDLATLKICVQQARDVPCVIPAMAIAENVIEDDGHRYCVCGGCADGVRVMVVCEVCDLWYHSECQRLNKKAADDIDEWICAPCCVKNGIAYPNYTHLQESGGEEAVAGAAKSVVRYIEKKKATEEAARLGLPPPTEEGLFPSVVEEEGGTSMDVVKDGEDDGVGVGLLKKEQREKRGTRGSKKDVGGDEEDGEVKKVSNAVLRANQPSKFVPQLTELWPPSKYDEKVDRLYEESEKVAAQQVAVLAAAAQQDVFSQHSAAAPQQGAPQQQQANVGERERKMSPSHVAAAASLNVFANLAVQGGVLGAAAAGGSDVVTTVPAAQGQSEDEGTKKRSASAASLEAEQSRAAPSGMKDFGAAEEEEELVGEDEELDDVEGAGGGGDDDEEEDGETMEV
jgi:hypothetical protein